MAVTLIGTGSNASSNPNVSATYNNALGTISSGHIVVLAGENDNETTPSCADTASGGSNTYRRDDNHVNGANVGTCAFIAPVTNNIESGDTFTVTWGANATRKGIIVYHVDDLVDGSLLDNGRAAASSQSPSATLDASVSQTDTVTFMGGCVISDGNLAWTPGGDGGTKVDTSNRTIVSSYRVRAASGQHSEGGTFTDTAANWAAVIVCYEVSAGGQSVAVGQASETDAARAMTRAKRKGFVQASETDAARAITPRRTYALGQAAETESARVITWSPKNRLIGQASETDSARAITPRKTKTITQAAETDTSRALAKRIRIDSYEKMILAHAPDSYWRMDETGSTQSDEVGGVTGTFEGSGATKGAASLLTEEQNAAYTTGTSGARLDVGDVYDFTGQVAFSFEVWFTASLIDSTFRMLLHKRTGTDGWNMWVQNPGGGGRVGFERIASSTFQGASSAAGTITTSTVYHVVATYDGTTLRTYINGDLAAETSSNNVSLPDIATRMAIGASETGGNGFQGTIDEVAVYDYVLTPARVFEHYVNRGHPFEVDEARTLTRRKTKVIGQASETDSARGFAKRIAVGRPSETDSARAITARKTVAIGQATETDSARALNRLKTRALGQCTETDAARAITWKMVRLATQANETDAARTFTSHKRRAIGQAAEVASARAITAEKTRTIGQASETDAARTIEPPGAQVIQVGQASETDAARAITSRKTRALGRVEEADSSRAITTRKTRSINQASEVDTARAISAVRSYVISPASETDAARSLAWAPKHRLVGQSSEVGAARAITARKTRVIVQATEVDAARAITWSVRRLVTQATETDAARAIAVHQATLIGQPSETDTARAVTWKIVRLVGQASETNSVHNIVPEARVLQVEETDTARAFTKRRTYALGQATETSAARAVSASRGYDLGRAAEVDAARAFDSAKTKAFTQAVETDAARAYTVERAYALARASETDAARALAHAKRKLIAQCIETDASRAFTVRRSFALAQALETDAATAFLSRKTRTFTQCSELDEAIRMGTGVIEVAIGRPGETSAARAFIRGRARGDLTGTLSLRGTMGAALERRDAGATLVRVDELEGTIT